MNIRFIQLDMFFIFRQRINGNEAAALTNFAFEKLAEESKVFPDMIAGKAGSQSCQNNVHRLTIKTLPLKKRGSSLL